MADGKVRDLAGNQPARRINPSVSGKLAGQILSFTNTWSGAGIDGDYQAKSSA